MRLKHVSPQSWHLFHTNYILVKLSTRRNDSKLLIYFTVYKITKSPRFVLAFKLASFSFGGLKRGHIPVRKFSIFQVTPGQGSNKERRGAVAGGQNKYFRANPAGKRVNRKGPVQPEVRWPHLRWCNLPNNRIPSQRPLQFTSGLHKYCN